MWLLFEGGDYLRAVSIHRNTVAFNTKINFSIWENNDSLA